MRKIALYILTGLVTSFFLFPFNLPGISVEVNTKMLLAVVGVLLFVLDRIRGDGLTISKDFLILSLICIAISIWVFGVMQMNHSTDSSFTTYFVSVWVWFGAAYAVVWLIKAAYGIATVEKIGQYMIVVGVVQCLIAYSMTFWPGLRSFIDSLMGEGHGYMGVAEGRLYGLGAALDPSGLRFSAILVIDAFLTARTDFDATPGKGILYVIAFILIAVIGNMIARSTTIGLVVSILLYIFMKWPRGGVVTRDRSWGIMGAILLSSIIVAVVLYRVNPAFRENIRFGFEGFFSIAEKGRWETHSTNILKSMVVWPESLKTWLIGDGYFAYANDLPDRFGQVNNSYYMLTDIGYLRYIFYFGVIGLIGMIAVFVQMTATCIRRLPGNTALFLMLLVVNLIGWVKVSSDIIMAFAPFVVLAYLTDSEEAER